MSSRSTEIQELARTRIDRMTVSVIAVLFAAAVIPTVAAESGKPSEADATAAEWKAELAERSRWWSLQPPKRTSPQLTASGSVGDSPHPVDRFLLKELQSAGLGFVEPAGAEVLLRRISFVLTGLPPAPEEIQAFREAYTKDADAALEALVDQRLASPHFGERFARHWMDVVRYTASEPAGNCCDRATFAARLPHTCQFLQAARRSARS